MNLNYAYGYSIENNKFINMKVQLPEKLVHLRFRVF